MLIKCIYNAKLLHTSWYDRQKEEADKINETKFNAYNVNKFQGAQAYKWDLNVAIGEWVFECGMYECVYLDRHMLLFSVIHDLELQLLTANLHICF